VRIEERLAAACDIARPAGQEVSGDEH
jgi:hypothetical protein